MISYLIDGVLMVALATTSLLVLRTHREIKQLRMCRDEFVHFVDQTTLAFESAHRSVQEFNMSGAKVLEALGSRIDEARKMVVELDAWKRERQADVGRQTQGQITRTPRRGVSR